MAGTFVKENKWRNVFSKYCLKCVVRHLTSEWNIVVGTDEDIIKYLQSKHEISIEWIDAGNNSMEEEKVEGSTETNQVIHNIAFCYGCSNILKTEFVNNCMKIILARLDSKSYEFTDFQLLITMPLSLIVQGRAIKLTLVEKLGSTSIVQKPFAVKDVFKSLLEPMISAIFSAKRKVNADFEISLTISNSQADQRLLPQLKFFHPQVFQSSWKKRRFHKNRKPAELQMTIIQVINALNLTSDYDLHNWISKLDASVVCKPNFQFKNQPIYLAGRYNKYSRNLSQTPWIIDGVRKTEESVEEYVAKPLQAAFGASGFNFSSSGREDVDVRMLGNGRPFLIELTNPRKITVSKSILPELENEINAQTPDVAISKLKLVDKLESKLLLKDGESEKTKSYSALCYFIDTPSAEQLEKLKNLHQNKEIVVEQRTPIRVLHRRPLATRPRKVLTMKAEPLTDDCRQFKLDLETQAGTYVKEFVHGDFGRTVPSLQSFLGAEVDIIGLDVTAVNLEWPPNSKTD